MTFPWCLRFSDRQNKTKKILPILFSHSSSRNLRIRSPDFIKGHPHAFQYSGRSIPELTPVHIWSMYQSLGTFREANSHESPLARVAIATSTMVAWIQHDGRKWLWTSHFSRLERWAYYRLYEDALANLSRLHILLNSTVKLALNFTFKTSMRQALTGG